MSIMDQLKYYRTTIAMLIVIASTIIAGCASAQKAALKGTVLNKKEIEAQTTPALQALSPTLDVAKKSDGTYDFTFSAYASGGTDSPQMQALRSIRRIS